MRCGSLLEMRIHPHGRCCSWGIGKVSGSGVRGVNGSAHLKQK